MTLWRTGRGEPHCIYRGDELMGMALDIDNAALIVRAMNERGRERSEILNPETVEFPAPRLPIGDPSCSPESAKHSLPE